MKLSYKQAAAKAVFDQSFVYNLEKMCMSRVETISKKWTQGLPYQ